MSRPLIPLKEAARRLGVSEKTVKRRAIPFTRSSEKGKRLYNPDDLERFATRYASRSTFDWRAA